MEEKKIKILICYHKKAHLFADDILTPIHVGRANAKKNLDPHSENYKWLMENMIGDDTGDNISDKNATYNEMTALYWAWKNYDVLGNPDYIGLMHYRRHFVIKGDVQAVYNIQNFDPEIYFDQINYSPKTVHKLVEGCDFLTHIGKVNNVYRHFIENQRKEDIDLANEILLEKYPEYKEVLKEYYAGDYSNFCNMNIFSRELFFEYCEWIFSILEEFEKRVDISEKRFFISERLSGIFIAKLMKNKKMTYKILPLAFLEESLEVPVAMKVGEEKQLSEAVAITSILEAAKGYHSYHFYLFCDSDVTEQTKDKFRYFQEKYQACNIDFIDCDISRENLPLYLSQMLPKLNKCIYLSGQVVALFDIGEFFRISSTDDYYILGIPQGKYDPEEKVKRITGDLLVLNCSRMRKHEIGKLADEVKGKDGLVQLNELCRGEIGYIPWYLFTSERLSGYSEGLLYGDKTRGRIQEEALWRPFLIYDKANPIENNQGIYSIFWWDTMKRIPLSFQKMDVKLSALRKLYALQQMEINEHKIFLPPGFSMKEVQSNMNIQEDWRKYNLLGKLNFYYRHNGLKNTIIYAGKKLIGKG